MRTAATRETLVAAIWPTQGTGIARALLLVFAGSLLLAISAKVQVPFWPVPMTMQTMVVLVLGFAFGPALGSASVALYLLEGALGLPVFAGTPEKGIGLAYMVGPTGGYLVGFLASAAVMGALARRGWDRSIVGALGGLVVGEIIIYGCGIAWLSTLVGFDKAFALGLLPFALGEGLKLALAAAVLPGCWKLAGKSAS